MKIKIKRDNTKYTPPPAKPVGEPQPFDAALAMIGTAKKKSQKK